MICLLHNFSVSYSFSYTAFVVVVVYMHVLFYFSKLETLQGQQAVWFSTLSLYVSIVGRGSKCDCIILFTPDTWDPLEIKIMDYLYSGGCLLHLKTLRMRCVPASLSILGFTYLCSRDWEYFFKNFFSSPPAFSAPCVSQNPASQPHPDDAEQQAAFLLACSGDTLPASLPPVNMYDLFEALQVFLKFKLALCECTWVQSVMACVWSEDSFVGSLLSFRYWTRHQVCTAITFSWLSGPQNHLFYYLTRDSPCSDLKFIGYLSHEKFLKIQVILLNAGKISLLKCNRKHDFKLSGTQGSHSYTYCICP